MSANDRQEGGDHYKRFEKMQPWDVIIAWGLGFLDGNVVKYVSRWRTKGGLDDLKKARHYLDKLIEEEEVSGRKEMWLCSTCITGELCKKEGVCQTRVFRNAVEKT